MRSCTRKRTMRTVPWSSSRCGHRGTGPWWKERQRGILRRKDWRSGAPAALASRSGHNARRLQCSLGLCKHRNQTTCSPSLSLSLSVRFYSRSMCRSFCAYMTPFKEEEEDAMVGRGTAEDGKKSEGTVATKSAIFHFNTVHLLLPLDLMVFH